MIFQGSPDPPPPPLDPHILARLNGLTWCFGHSLATNAISTIISAFKHAMGVHKNRLIETQTLYILDQVELTLYVIRFKSVCSSAQSDQSHSFLSEETLDPWLPIELQPKTLIRLCGYAG